MNAKVSRESMLVGMLEHEVKVQRKHGEELSNMLINYVKTIIKLIANHPSFNWDCNVKCPMIAFNSAGGITVLLENKRNHRLMIAIYEAAIIITLTNIDGVPSQRYEVDSLDTLSQLLTNFEKDEEKEKPSTNSIPGRVSALDMVERTGRLYRQGAINLMSKIYQDILDRGSSGYLVYDFKHHGSKARLPFIVKTLELDGYAVIVDFVKEELIINWYIPVGEEKVDG
jgi:hypothetical protein